MGVSGSAGDAEWVFASNNGHRLLRDEGGHLVESRLKELDDVLGTKLGELREVLDDTKQEQAALEEKRREAEEAVDARYLRAYKRLRSRLRDGRAVVPLERGAAAGFAVPPQRQVEIRQGNRIVACEHTGRIIVDSDMYLETVDEMKL